MSVNRAYITSLWTTGILVASSLLVLALTSAIVVFKGWPGSGANAPVDRVTIGSPAAKVLERPVSPQAGHSRHAARTPTSSGGRSVGGPTTRRPSGGTANAPRVGSTPGSISPGAHAAAIKQPSNSGPSSPKPEPKAGDPVRNVGNTVGGQLDPVSPEAGGTTRSIAGSGADAVDALPPVPG
jgi:hypothetical protein